MCSKRSLSSRLASSALNSVMAAQLCEHHRQARAHGKTHQIGCRRSREDPR
jgi:hypothetical protein